MLFIATIAGSISAASAQDYPTRPIRLLHGFAAGGAADTLSRILANGLSKRLGQPIVIEAKPGRAAISPRPRSPRRSPTATPSGSSPAPTRYRRRSTSRCLTISSTVLR